MIPFEPSGKAEARSVSMRQLLESLGLGVREDFGDLVFDLRAIEGEARVRLCMGRLLEPVALVNGWHSDGRTMGEIKAELPAQFATEEEGLAWLAHVSKPLFGQSPPEWLAHGLALEEHLPWVREKRAWEARPKCVVRRPWLRLAGREIRASASICADSATIRWMFDGATLLVDGYRLRVAMPAYGLPWLSSIEVSALVMRRFARRIMSEQIEISVWQGKLMCGGEAFGLAGARAEPSYND